MWEQQERREKARSDRLDRLGHKPVHVDGESRRIYATRLVGRTVRKGRSVRTIRAVFRDAVGGVLLDRPLRGTCYWNIESLRGVSRRYWERNWLEREGVGG